LTSQLTVKIVREGGRFGGCERGGQSGRATTAVAITLDASRRREGILKERRAVACTARKKRRKKKTLRKTPRDMPLRRTERHYLIREGREINPKPKKSLGGRRKQPH